LSLNESCIAPIVQFPSVTFDEKESAAGNSQIQKARVSANPPHSDTIISMNSGNDPCASRNLPPAIGRLICCCGSLPQKCGETFRSSLSCENEGPALRISGFHVRTLSIRRNRRTKRLAEQLPTTFRPDNYKARAASEKRDA